MKDEEVTMHYKTFDTHKYIKSLQESGFNEKQAEMLVKSLLESRDFDLSILATREQVARLDGKIDKIESNLNTKIDKVESNLEKQISATREQVSNVETQIKELSNTISSNKYDIIKLWNYIKFVNSFFIFINPLYI
jgi:chromosome segregation ATPase